MKDGKEIDAYVGVRSLTIASAALPSGQSGGSIVDNPPEYGSMVSYVVSEDAEGSKLLSHGEVAQVFDIGMTDSIGVFLDNVLKDIKYPKLDSIQKPTNALWRMP